MSRTRFSRTVRIAAVAYPLTMAAGGLLVSLLDASREGPAVLSWLAQPGVTFLYAFVLLPFVVLFGDPVGAEAPTWYGLPLAYGLGAALNILLAAGASCCARQVAAELPWCRRRRAARRPPTAAASATADGPGKPSGGASMISSSTGLASQ